MADIRGNTCMGYVSCNKTIRQLTASELLRGYGPFAIAEEASGAGVTVYPIPPVLYPPG